jgi:hypothetical protein
VELGHSGEKPTAKQRLLGCAPEPRGARFDAETVALGPIQIRCLLGAAKQVFRLLKRNDLAWRKWQFDEEVRPVRNRLRRDIQWLARQRSELEQMGGTVGYVAVRLGVVRCIIEGMNLLKGQHVEDIQGDVLHEWGLDDLEGHLQLRAVGKRSYLQ